MRRAALSTFAILTAFSVNACLGPFASHSYALSEPFEVDVGYVSFFKLLRPDAHYEWRA